MIVFLYALPMVLFFIAIGLLFVDFRKQLWIAVGASSVGLILLISTLLLAYLSQADQKLLLKTVEKQQHSAENQTKQRGLLLAQLAATRKQPKQHYDHYTKFGLSIKNPFFVQLDKINTHINALIEKPGARSSSKVKVYRLPEDTNQLLLAVFLDTLGYEAYIPDGNSDDESAEEDQANEEGLTDDKESDQRGNKQPKTKKVTSSQKDNTDKADAEESNKGTNDNLAESKSKESPSANSNDQLGESENEEVTGDEDPLVDGDQVIATSTTDITKLQSLLNFKTGDVSVTTKEQSDDHDSDKSASTALSRPPLATANVMYYGTGVSDYDIKVIALALMRSGINLKGIRTFKESDRPYDIELDWSPFYERRATISAEKIVSKKSIGR